MSGEGVKDPILWEQVRDTKLQLTGTRRQADRLEAEIAKAKREQARVELLVRNLERRRQGYVDKANQLLHEIARLENAKAEKVEREMTKGAES